MKLLASLLVLVESSPELCMVDYDDRLPCTLDEPLSYFECSQIGCCYDSNVPEDVPHCYFRKSGTDNKSEQTSALELIAEPLWVTSGSFSTSKKAVKDEIKMEKVEGPVLSMEQLDEMMQNGQLIELVNGGKKCVIPESYDVTKLKRCGRRGVPRKRCEDIECCWNENWRPGGKHGPRCFHHDMDLEHYGKPREREFTNLAMPEQIKSEEVTDTGARVDSTLNFLEDKKEDLQDALKECEPNHNQLQCIQGPEERVRCDIREQLSLGIKPCDACLHAGCCFDPMPKIVGNAIMPLCFKYGPLAEIGDLGIEPTETIPSGPFGHFSKQIDTVEDEEPGRIPGPGPMNFEQQRLEALRNRKTHEPVVDDMEIEGFDIKGVHPEQGAPIIQFGATQKQDLNDDFAQLDRSIDELHQQEANHMSERQQKLLEIMKERNPEWEKYFNADGSPKLTQNEEQKDGKTNIQRLKEKYEATKLASSTTTPPTTTTTTSTTTTTTTFSSHVATYTKPDLDLSDLYPSVTEAPMKVQPGDLEKSKREAIENQLNMLRRIYVQVGMSESKIELEISKKRASLEAKMGILTTKRIMITTTTSQRTTSTTSTTSTTPRPIRPMTENTLPFFEPEPSSRQRCYPTTCGQPNIRNKKLQKIVGGQWAGSAQYWPWQASLRRSFSDSPKFYPFCGATLISERWILTAAHCFIRHPKWGEVDNRMMEYDITHFLVHFGRYTLNQHEAHSQVRSLDHFIQHPGYRPWGNQKNDIAVAKLAGKPVTVTDYVRPVCLPTFVPPVGDKLIITGWGGTENVGNSNIKLKEIALPLASQQLCAEQWGEYFNDGWMCTDPAFLEDACKGDSGGPAVFFDEFKNHFAIVGVTIAGSRTCSTTRGTIKAGVYSNVLYYEDWIDEATNFGCA